jgi:hypothetical protein
MACLFVGRKRVTVSEGLVVFCNGRRGRCPSRFESNEAYTLAALVQATSCGWDAQIGQLHYCPACRTPPDAGLDLVLEEPAYRTEELDESTITVGDWVSQEYERLRRDNGRDVQRAASQYVRWGAAADLIWSGEG